MNNYDIDKNRSFPSKMHQLFKSNVISRYKHNKLKILTKKKVLHRLKWNYSRLKTRFGFSFFQNIKQIKQNGASNICVPILDVDGSSFHLWCISKSEFEEYGWTNVRNNERTVDASDVQSKQCPRANREFFFSFQLN